jgi:hypothetical protein
VRDQGGGMLETTNLGLRRNTPSLYRLRSSGTEH